MDAYNGLSLFVGDVLVQFISIITIVVVVSALSLTYYIQCKKHGYANQTKFMAIINIAVQKVKMNVNDIMGPKYLYVTPLILMIATYVLFANTIYVFSFAEPTSSLTVTATLGFFTWFTTLCFGIKTSKLRYLSQFVVKIKNKEGKTVFAMVNPLEIVSKLTPLISLSFRLWGNILSGVIITSLVHWALENVTIDYPWVGLIFIGSPTILPFFLVYFSLFSGFIQTIVFMNLSLTYWSLETNNNQ